MPNVFVTGADITGCNWQNNGQMVAVVVSCNFGCIITVLVHSASTSAIFSNKYGSSVQFSVQTLCE